MQLRHFFTIIFFLFSLQQSKGQNVFPFFKEKSILPENLLKTRTVVFMNVNNLKWEDEAKILHKKLRVVGIDAVAYYALADILSGHDATNAFYNDISSRSISSMVIINKNDVGQYTAYIGDFADGGSFFEPGMEVYQISADDLEKLGALLVMKVDQAKLERENFLIIDIPEIFKRTNVIKTRRVADYNPDLRIDKLAVPRFEGGVMVSQNIDSLNASLDSIMAKNYPFRYGLVDSDITDDEMISQGYLMVIRKLENNIESLKRMLGYEIIEDETVHISIKKGDPDQLKKIFAKQNGHKYYVQQLYTKDIYLGNEWDADTTWEEALRNHIANLKVDQKR
jgi:hypothetical protein